MTTLGTIDELLDLPVGTEFRCQCDYPGKKLGQDLWEVGNITVTTVELLAMHTPLVVES